MQAKILALENKHLLKSLPRPAARRTATAGQLRPEETELGSEGRRNNMNKSASFHGGLQEEGEDGVQRSHACLGFPSPAPRPSPSPPQSSGSVHTELSHEGARIQGGAGRPWGQGERVTRNTPWLQLPASRCTVSTPASRQGHAGRGAAADQPVPRDSSQQEGSLPPISPQTHVPPSFQRPGEHLKGKAGPGGR